MKLAVIDNVDSFVYNLVQCLGEMGADIEVFRNNVSLNKIEASDPDGAVISPGPKRPEDAGVSSEVVREFCEEIPILGVCLGHQVIARVFGGRIRRSKNLMHGKTSKIEHDGTFLFEGIRNPFEATRYHSLAVDEETLPENLRVTCRTKDEDRELMGIEHMDHPIFGVQFHPESILTTDGKEILKNFLVRVKN